MRLTDMGFTHAQYSHWIKNTNALDAYISMLSLMDIEPPGKFQSTLKSVKIHHQAHPDLDGTNAIRLGGIYSPDLLGPTPAHLVPENVPSIPPQVLQELPRHTRVSAMALDANNWRIRP